NAGGRVAVSQALAFGRLRGDPLRNSDRSHIIVRADSRPRGRASSISSLVGTDPDRTGISASIETSTNYMDRLRSVRAAQCTCLPAKRTLGRSGRAMGRYSGEVAAQDASTLSACL